MSRCPQPVSIWWSLTPGYSLAAAIEQLLFADLKRLQEKLQSGCEIPPAPLALVTPSSDQPVEYEPVALSEGCRAAGCPRAARLRKSSTSLFPTTMSRSRSFSTWNVRPA